MEGKRSRHSAKSEPSNLFVALIALRGFPRIMKNVAKTAWWALRKLHVSMPFGKTNMCIAWDDLDGLSWTPHIPYDFLQRVFAQHQLSVHSNYYSSTSLFKLLVIGEYHFVFVLRVWFESRGVQHKHIQLNRALHVLCWNHLELGVRTCHIFFSLLH